MECDFYTFYQLCIRYKRDNEIIVFAMRLDDTKKSHDWWNVNYNEDFEELEEYYQRKMEKEEYQIHSVLEEYPTVHLCVEGTWKCIASAKQKYLELAKSVKISESDILDIWKQGEYQLC